MHVQTTGRNQRGEVVLTFQRKVQVWKRDESAKISDAQFEPKDVPVSLEIPAYDPKAKYGALAHFSSPDTYFEDFTAGDTLEHTRARVVTTDHIMLTGVLDNTSQVHCNQWMVEENPDRFVGGKLIVFGGIHSTSASASRRPMSATTPSPTSGTSPAATPPQSSPATTVFASTEITATRDFDGRPDLGVLDTILRGHKFVKKEGETKKIEIFYLEREVAVKRRSHYT